MWVGHEPGSAIGARTVCAAGVELGFTDIGTLG